MEQTKRIEAILLAAGYSSRMGALKPLLPIGGTTVIRRQVEMLKDVVDRTVVVTGYRGPEVESHLTGCQVTSVRNPAFDEGMFTSVKAGIAALSPDAAAFLLLPVDYPLVTGEMIKKLLSLYDNRGDCVVAYPSYHRRRGHPPVISASCIPGILCYEGEMGLKGALTAYDNVACYLETEDERCVIDMDTPVDYWNVLALASMVS